jgi:uncharacterized protein (DUF1778 family)
MTKPTKYWTKQIMVCFRMTAEEKKILVAAAKAELRSFSSFLRTAALERAKKGKRK